LGKQIKCTFLYGDSLAITSLNRKESPQERKYAIALNNFAYRWAPWVVPLTRYALMIKPSIFRNNGHKGPKVIKNNGHDGPKPGMGLQPGDWVEVRTKEEIEATLDGQGKLRGLQFMPEMGKFCGKRLRVLRRVQKFKLETTGEMRNMRYPSYYLDGAWCDGEFHDGCERSCFLLWREEWLKKIPTESTTKG
jgi:hypothetical protein